MLAQKKHEEVADYEIFWRRYYYRMLDALENTKRKENLESWIVKIHTNTEIVRDAKFQESVHWMKQNMHKLSYLAYRTKSYLCVIVVNFALTKVIYKLERHMKKRRCHETYNG
jgi:hypothetical protein